MPAPRTTLTNPPALVITSWTTYDLVLSKTGYPLLQWRTRSPVGHELLWPVKGPHVHLDICGGDPFLRNRLGDILYGAQHPGSTVHAFYRRIARGRRDRLTWEVDFMTNLGRLIGGRPALLQWGGESYLPAKFPQVWDPPQVAVAFDLTQPEDPA